MLKLNVNKFIVLILLLIEVNEYIRFAYIYKSFFTAIENKDKNYDNAKTNFTRAYYWNGYCNMFTLNELIKAY